MPVRAPAVGPYPMSQHAGSTHGHTGKDAQRADFKRVECAAYLVRVLPLTRAWGSLDERPPGLHNHDSKQPLSRERGQAQLMESALSGNVDAPIGAIAAV